MLKLKYIPTFYWSCDYFKLCNLSINTKHYRQGYSYKIYMKSECNPLKSPMLFPTEQANIYIKYGTNFAWHRWWGSCFLWLFAWSFSSFHFCFTPHPAHLTLNYLTLSPFPLLFYLVLLSKLNSLAYAQLHKAACLTTSVTLLLSQSFWSGLKQEGFSVQWYLWTPTGKTSYRNLHTRCILLQNLKS